MTSSPILLRTKVESETIGDLAYRIEGELVPVLHLRLGGEVNIYFEHHVLFWKTPELAIKAKVGGFVKRRFAGMSAILMETNSSGSLAFSRNAAGHVFGYHLAPGDSLLVREGQWLAASNNIKYEPHVIKGLGNKFVGGNGFWQIKFTNNSDSDGVVWLHGYGNVFSKELAPGEAFDVEPGAWVYYTPSITLQQTGYGVRTGLLAGGNNIFFNRFIGPGEVGLQSMYEKDTSSPNAKMHGNNAVYSSDDGN